MIYDWIYDRISRYRLRKCIKQGLQIADDCRLISMPDFGSECFLISIGKRVTTASNITFLTHDGGTRTFRDHPEYKGVINYGRIAIHDNCWIGKGCTLPPGISIGPNSIVGACPVVTKDIPPSTVACGVPARVIKTLEAYAEASMAAIPPYDREACRTDKVAELLRHYPRPR